MAALAAERIKLFSTRAPLAGLAGAAVASLGLAALQAAGRGTGPLTPADAALGVAVVAVPVLMVLASMTVTGEFRSEMIRTTFLAIPDRKRVLVAKAVLTAAFAATAAAVLVILSVLIADALAPPLATELLSLGDPATWAAVGSFGLYAAIAAVLGVGVGTLIRAAPGTVAVLLLWPLVIETVLGVLPDTGDRIGPYLPFANAYTFLEIEWLYPGSALGGEMRWGPLGALLYFVAVVAVVFVAALVVVDRRDP
ncbi:MAG: ABC transporter permease [Mycobacterium sp.]